MNKVEHFNQWEAGPARNTPQTNVSGRSRGAGTSLIQEDLLAPVPNHVSLIKAKKR